MLLLKFCNNLQIFKISVFYLIYFLTRLENKVAESTQAKARLSKPWLATDEANCSRVVFCPTLVGYFFFKIDISDIF